MNIVEQRNNTTEFYKERPHEKIIMQNTRTILSVVKTLEYKVNILENVLKEILREIKECRQNEM